LPAWTTAAPVEAEPIRPPGGGPVHSLVWMSGGGVPRLLIADKRPALSLYVLGDAYHAEYRASQPLRWAAAADDLIVAVNEPRDQIILWRPEEPEEPLAAVSIGRLCGHSVQDVALLAGTMAAPPDEPAFLA